MSIFTVVHFLFMYFCPGMLITHAESIKSTGQTFTTHTTFNTEKRVE